MFVSQKVVQYGKESFLGLLLVRPVKSGVIVSSSPETFCSTVIFGTPNDHRKNLLSLSRVDTRGRLRRDDKKGYVGEGKERLQSIQTGDITNI